MNERADKDSKHDSAVKTILSLGEERMGEVVNQLLQNEAFVSAMQRAISGSLAAKKNVDRGVSTLLGLVNVPTLDDVVKIKERLDEAEQSLQVIGERLNALNHKLDARK